MVWKDLIEILYSKEMKLVKQEDAEKPINIVKYISSEKTDVKENTIFFCNISDLDKKLSGQFAFTAFNLHKAPADNGIKPSIVILSEHDLDADVFEYFSNVLLIYNAECFEKFYAETISVRDELAKIEVKFHVIFENIIKGCSIQKVINDLSLLYNHYCVLQNNTLNRIAASNIINPPKNFPSQEFLYDYGLKKGWEFFETQGYSQQIESSKKAVYIRHEEVNIYAYTIPTYSFISLKTGLFSIYVEEDETLSPVLLYSMVQASRILSMVMQYGIESNTSKSLYIDQVLSDMMNGIVPQDSYEKRFMAYNYSLKEWKNIIAIDLEKNISDVSKINLISRLASITVDNSVYIVKGHFLYLLTSRSGYIIDENKFEEINRFLISKQLHAGISSSFTNTLSATDFFKQALKTLTIGRRLNPEKYMHLYDNIWSHDIAHIISKSGPLSAYYFPPFLSLIQEDAKEGQYILCETLLCFLKNSCSIRDTSAALFIHRNTLYSRLEKIHSVMGCDIMRAEIISRVIFTVALMKFDDRLPKPLQKYEF